jgi:hypothetical protein
LQKEWEIEKSLNKCDSCGKEFAEKEEYFSEIYEAEGGFARKDFCPSCWQGPSEKRFSFWKTRLPEKEEKPKKFIDMNVIFDFFERLADAHEKDKENFRYILALVLMRKRKLKFEGTKREETGEFMILREAGTKHTYNVKNPGLTEEEVGGLTEKIGEILNMDL